MTLRLLRLCICLSVWVFASACGGAFVSAKSPEGRANSFARAFELEQRSGAKEATSAYLDLVDDGVLSGPDGLAAVLAALDALTKEADVPALERLPRAHALAFRTKGGLHKVEERLKTAYESARGQPFARAAIARALLDIAVYEGDAARAKTYRERTGAVSRATIIGPLSTRPLASALSPSTAFEAKSPLGTSYPGVAPFGAASPPEVFDAEDGLFRLSRVNRQFGAYAIVVDVESAREQEASFVLASSTAATASVGGVALLVRSPEEGDDVSNAFGRGRVHIPKGRTRVIVRVAKLGEEARVGIAILDADGAPLPTFAPAAGESAPGEGSRASVVVLRAGGGDALGAAALLAAGGQRAARALLEETLHDRGASPADSNASPLVALLFARSVSHATDIPPVRRRELARAAYERSRAAWPNAWEANIGAVLLDSARKGASEGAIEAIGELQTVSSSDPVVQATIAVLAADEKLTDVADASLAGMRSALGDSPLYAELNHRVHPRVGVDAEKFACETELLDHASRSCLFAAKAVRDLARFRSEIARHSALEGRASDLARDELDEAIAEGDVAEVLKLYDEERPAERNLDALALASGKADEVRRRVDHDAPSAHGSPELLADLASLTQPDRTRAIAELERRGKEAVAADRRAPSSVEAATLVLVHDERYALTAHGLLTYLVHDVRKVSGTMEVEKGAGNVFPNVWARDARRTLRRLVHKKDGRVLEAEKLAARQSNVDVSQLEPGDYVEQVIGGYLLPGLATGQLVVDTPDLMPDRTGIRSASIELRYPKSVALKRWSHALLGAARESSEGDERVVRFELANVPPRRIETGVPRPERGVLLSFGTYDQTFDAEFLAETLLRYRERDPFVVRWVREVVGPKPEPTRELVDRVIAAVGHAVVSNGNFDYARVALERAQGNRALLIHRALAEAKVPVSLWLAEAEPYASDPAYPPHPGRFSKPVLLVALSPGEGGNLWVEPDVQGPPLPAGRVSRELRGRTAISASGELRRISQAADDEAPDAIELALKLDAKGDAAGTLTMNLRGREANTLAYVLEKVAEKDRETVLRSVVLAWFPWATVNDVAVVSKAGSFDVALRADVAFASYAEPQGSAFDLPGFLPVHHFVPSVQAGTLGENYATLLGRSAALSISRTVNYVFKRRVELPAATKFARPLPHFSTKHERLDASRTVKWDAGVLEEEFRVGVSTGTVAPGAYARFAAEVKRVDEAFLESIRISR